MREKLRGGAARERDGGQREVCGAGLRRRGDGQYSLQK